MNIEIQLDQNTIQMHTMHSMLIGQCLHLFKLIMLHSWIFGSFISPGAIYQLILILNGISRLSILCHKIH